MQKVTGIGGVIFKARNPNQLMQWYEENLGLQFQYGFVQFKWADDQGNKPTGSTTFAISKEDAENFVPSEKPFMINFRVSDLRALLKELADKGLPISSEVQEFDFGKFGWVMDPEGNKVELWEPIDD